jgi:glycosyltransferase involved in cell wall biosynthesis
MRIGIDARMIEHSGIGSYIKTLVSYIGKFDKNDYVLFGDPGKLEQFNIPVIKADFPVYSITEQIKLPGLLKKSGIDLFHETHYNVPYFYNGKLITTIHDLIHLIMPEFLPSKAAYLYAKFMIAYACKKSEKIITISQHTKNDLVKYFNVEPSKIEVIYIGVNPVFKPSKEISGEMTKKIGKYILYVGAVRPHKNVHTLIEAFIALRNKHNIEHKLVLIGKGKPEYIAKIGSIIALNKLENIVLRPEVKSQEELAKYYCGADIFVFPSLYEGFGLPPLEAMACGCPVISSNTSSLPEVIGDAGIMVGPKNVNAFADSIYNVISDPELKRSMSLNGIARSKSFSYEKTVKETAEIYNQILSNS